MDISSLPQSESRGSFSFPAEYLFFIRWALTMFSSAARKAGCLQGKNLTHSAPKFSSLDKYLFVYAAKISVTCG